MTDSGHHQGTQLALLQTALEKSRTSAWDLDLTSGRYRLAPAVRWLGYGDGEVGTDLESWRTITHADDLAAVSAALDTCAAGRGSYSCDYRVRSKHGEWRWLADRGEVSERDADGAARRIAGTLTDITERKLAELTAQGSVEHFQLLTGKTEEVFRITDWPNRQLLYVSPSYEKVFQQSCQSLHEDHHHWLERVHPDERARVRESFANGASLGVFVEEVYQIVRNRGQLRWIRDRAYPVLDSQGRVSRIVGFAEDITEQKRVEEGLREGEQRFRGLVEMMSEGLLVQDKGSRVTYVNDRLCEIWGYPREDLVGSSFDRHLGQAAREQLRTRLGDGWERARTPFDLELTRPDGEVRKIVVSPRPLFDRIGEFCGSVAVLTDITERHRAEEERLALERQVQQAQKLESLGVLAGGIAHDFNNILVGILGNADLAQQELAPTAAGYDCVSEIVRASHRAADLCKQMLAYSGRGRFVIEPIHANQLIEEMAGLVEASISKKAALNCRFAKELPAFEGDATQIRQIVMNLIINASEALGDDGGVISISTDVVDHRSEGTDPVDEVFLAGRDKPLPTGRYVCLEVSDTGCGMDAPTQQQMFDPFFTTKFTGRGLGMAAVLGIVRAHEGAVQVHSQVGKGTTFTILFPASTSKSSPLERRSVAPGTSRGGHSGGLVLVADDEEMVRSLVERMLRRGGFSVLTAADGRQAVQLFREHADEIACVLLDLTMPHLDGEQAFAQLRRIRPEVKVVLCSGYSEQEATARFSGKGLAGFLQKPFGMSLLDKIQELI